jgi:hypothetical protein
VSRPNLYRRIQPRERDRDLQRGFLAVLHDPAWMLARQWQMGEMQGENASTPITVTCQGVRRIPIGPFGGNPLFDPQLVPIEPIVEAEPDSWWTLGRRIRLGATVAKNAGSNNVALPDAFRFSPPPPYEHLQNVFDGRALWQKRAEVPIPPAWFGDNPPPDDTPNSWDSDELVYGAKFPTVIGTLDIPRLAGGEVDWHSADLEDPLPLPGAGDVEHAVPTPLHYPGAPDPRWWTIEDANVDVGGFPPDRSQFPTLLLIDLICSHSNDWFLCPLAAQVGQVVTIDKITVKDAFDDLYTLPTVTDWTLFHTTGLEPTGLVIWPTAITPLQGPRLELVQFGVDEYSNLLWAVERRVDGQDVRPTPAPVGPAPVPVNVTDSKMYSYFPATNLESHWHPYRADDIPAPDSGDPRRRFVQGRFRPFPDAPRPEPPTARTLQPNAGAVHLIDPATIPVNGISIQRNYSLTRDVLGRPWLWVQRRRLPLLEPPARRIRFDVLEEAH